MAQQLTGSEAGDAPGGALAALRAQVAARAGGNSAEGGSRRSRFLAEVADEVPLMAAAPAPAVQVAKAKAKGSRKKNKGAAEAEEGEPTAAVLQKCSGRCKKELPASELFKDMAKCKGCFGKSRAYKTKLGQDLPVEKLAELQTNNPDVLEQCEKGFNDEWDRAKKENRKINYSVKNVVATLEAKSGQRYENEAPMMWKGAYGDWAASAQGGFLTKEEIEANWLGWHNDASHPRDNDGPRGFVQLAIPNAAKRLINYNDLSQSKALTMSCKLGKKITDAELAEKANALTSGFDNMSWNMDAMTSRASKAMSSVKAPTVAFEDGKQDR